MRNLAGGRLLGSFRLFLLMWLRGVALPGPDAFLSDDHARRAWASLGWPAEEVDRRVRERKQLEVDLHLALKQRLSQLAGTYVLKSQDPVARTYELARAFADSEVLSCSRRTRRWIQNVFRDDGPITASGPDWARLRHNPWFIIYVRHSFLAFARTIVLGTQPTSPRLFGDPYDRIHIVHASASNCFVTKDGPLARFIRNNRVSRAAPRVVDMTGLQRWLSQVLV
jgi:hypothetical protein